MERRLGPGGGRRHAAYDAGQEEDQQGHQQGLASRGEKEKAVFGGQGKSTEVLIQVPGPGRRR